LGFRARYPDLPGDRLPHSRFLGGAACLEAMAPTSILEVLQLDSQPALQLTPQRPLQNSRQLALQLPGG
jgi:hypothetical protein